MVLPAVLIWACVAAARVGREAVSGRLYLARETPAGAAAAAAPAAAAADHPADHPFVRSFDAGFGGSAASVDPAGGAASAGAPAAGFGAVGGFSGEARGATAASAGASSFLSPTAPSCEIAPEIVLVQDVSGSYEADMRNMRHAVPDLFAYLEREYKGAARFGIVSFVDKHVSGTAWASSALDYCAAVDLPLTPVASARAVEKAVRVFDSLVVGGGGDYLDGGNEALFRALLSPEVGWSEDDRDPGTGRPRCRIVVLATDAAVHEARFHARLAGLAAGDLPENALLAHPPPEFAADINARCGEMDYPSFGQLRAALEMRNALPVVLAGDPLIWEAGAPAAEGGGGSDGGGAAAGGDVSAGAVFGPRFPSQYRRDWVNRHRGASELNAWMDEAFGLRNFYASYFRDFVGVDVVAERLDNSSSNFLAAFKAALAEAAEHACNSGMVGGGAGGTAGGGADGGASGDGAASADGGSRDEASRKTDSNITPIVVASSVAGAAALAGGAAWALRSFGVVGGGAAAPPGGYAPYATPGTAIRRAAGDAARTHREQYEEVTGDLFV